MEQGTKRRRKKVREGDREEGPSERGAKSHSPKVLSDVESLETVALGDDAEETLQVMRAWLQTEETGGLSIAQTGALLAITIRRSGTPLGEYLSRSVVPGSGDGMGGRRQRGVLPLPLLEDSKVELRKIFENGEFRRLAGSWANKRQNKEKAAKAIRRIGMLVWHGLVVTALNVLWTGGGGSAQICTTEPTKSQQMALDRLWDRVRDFVDDSSESSDRVPKSPTLGEWGKKVGDVKISYTGDIIEKAHQLTLDQILPGLPPSGYGGSVPLIDLCEGELRERLLDPMGNILDVEEMPDDLPAPKVHASQGQWEAFSRW